LLLETLLREAFFLCLVETGFGSCEEGFEGRVCGVKSQAFFYIFPAL